MVQKAFPESFGKVQEVVLDVVFGSILIAHLLNCLREVRALENEVSLLQEDVLTYLLALSTTDGRSTSVARFAGLGMFKHMVRTFRRKKVGVARVELHGVQEIVADASDLLYKVLALETKYGDSLDSALFEVLLVQSQFDVEVMSAYLETAGNAAVLEKLVDFASRGISLGRDKPMLLAEPYDGPSDASVYRAGLVEELKRRMLLVQHLTSGCADSLASKHIIVQGHIARSSVTVNPQYLLFEFLSGFIIRYTQMKKIEELYRKCRNEVHQSAVHEMIMGSGKTTCIGLMLCLCLGLCLELGLGLANPIPSLNPNLNRNS